MARLTPGPYVSPLSSSLSAVVADEIRRGQDSPTNRRRPSGLRKSRSQRATVASSADETPVRASQLSVDAGETDGERPPTAIRSQSSAPDSASFRDFFRTNGEGSKGKGNERDGDDTPR